MTKSDKQEFVTLLEDALARKLGEKLEGVIDRKFDEKFETKFIPLFNQGFEDVVLPHINEIDQRLTRVEKSLGKLRNEIRNQRDQLASHDDRIKELEKTTIL